MTHSLRFQRRKNAMVQGAALLLALSWGCALADPRSPDDCITAAASYHSVDPLVLRAIAWNESRMRAGAIGRNTNGTRDLGVFQINSIHLPALAAYGISEKDLLDGCVASYVGAWRLRQEILRYGLTWKAIGAYHSRTPRHNARYANAIFHTLVQWKVLPPGAPPFPDNPRERATDLKNREN